MNLRQFYFLYPFFLIRAKADEQKEAAIHQQYLLATKVSEDAEVHLDTLKKTAKAIQLRIAELQQRKLVLKASDHSVGAQVGSCLILCPILSHIYPSLSLPLPLPLHPPINCVNVEQLHQLDTRDDQLSEEKTVAVKSRDFKTAARVQAELKDLRADREHVQAVRVF